MLLIWELVDFFIVDNLPYNTSVHELRRLFDRYGDIGDVYIPRDRYNNQSRGFGFVRFYSRKDADYACSRADGKQMNGRELRVSIAKYRRPLDEGRDRDRFLLSWLDATLIGGGEELAI
ncbi:RRM domain-containing protein [Meloidogyne graminicola]|uniref:Serine/arginine-rich splicing factor 2 n=1 Tax=Meloidogyne graminicola TaxID=189291 RepID=A0A8S9ZTB3_9BILA|nr:RRM domain-containing protein [Meloidogyne graminicola]